MDIMKIEYCLIPNIDSARYYACTSRNIWGLLLCFRYQSEYLSLKNIINFIYSVVQPWKVDIKKSIGHGLRSQLYLNYI